MPIPRRGRLDEQENDVRKLCRRVHLGDVLQRPVALEHVLDAGEVAGILLDAVGVVEAGRVDHAQRHLLHAHVDIVLCQNVLRRAPANDISYIYLLAVYPAMRGNFLNSLFPRRDISVRRASPGKVNLAFR